MPLTTLELQHLEKRLHEERARITAELREFTTVESVEDGEDRSGDISKFPTHPADLGTDTADEELDASLATRRSAELAEIDAALERIRNAPETVGLDERTGEPIPYARLQIIPWARTAAR